MPALSPSNVHDAVPSRESGTAVLLLAGSSGRVEKERADLMASRGARVRAIRWFGGEGQRPAPHEVPIELFIGLLDDLRRDHDRVAIVGTSFGAEAALVTASAVDVDVTVALSPSSVVWSGVVDGAWSSHWTLRGTPLPAVRFDPEWEPHTDPPEYVALYDRSMDLDPAVTADATIPVERIAGEVLLAAGGDDRVWPSARFADAIAERRRAHGRETTVVRHPRAGHRVILPGETAAVGGVRMVRGGSTEADAELGAAVWRELTRVLRLESEGR